MMFFRKSDDDTSKLEKCLADYRKNNSSITLHQIMGLFPNIPLFYTSLKPEVGPDNFPYVNLKLRAKNEQQITLKEIADKALNEGFGVTINKSVNRVDWVFSLGDFISLSRAGFLLSQDSDAGFQSKAFEQDTKIMVAAPNEDIIPHVVRKHLKNFMQTTLKIPDPKFYLMLNPNDKPPLTIIFNISHKDFRSQSEYQHTLGLLVWFFPKTVFVGSLENDRNKFYEI
jgi:hypothetical protein